MARAILFDLDGTLVDTRTASWELFEETNAAFGLGIDTAEAFYQAFEHNFFESLARLPLPVATLAAAREHFMQNLRERYCPRIIPGMADVVRGLAPDNILAVVSTNAMHVIRRILVNEGLATCFSHVFSGDVEQRKTVSIRRFLGRSGYNGNRLCAPDYHFSDTAPAQLEVGDIVLVTDTVGDVSEAVDAGVCAIGVSWGMHSEQQLLDAGAKHVALWPQELLAWLGGSSAQGACALPGAGSGGAAACGCASRAQDGCTCASAGCDCEGMANAGGAVAAHGIGQQRRQLQLLRRVQANESSVACLGSVRANPNAPDEELRQALARIMGGLPQSISPR